MCRTYEQPDARNGLRGRWFREVHMNWSRFELGLNDLPGRTANPLAAAQAVRIFSRPKAIRGARIYCGLSVLLG